MVGERAQRLSAVQNGTIGSLAGMIEVMLQYPMITMKNAVQVRSTHAAVVVMTMTPY